MCVDVWGRVGGKGQWPDGRVGGNERPLRSNTCVFKVPTPVAA